ncbi:MULTISPECIES: DUF4123 domain-containing protein [Pseudomonas syringae group]|uniref:DUF4123 domain-containing protein n=1 Tax=Pseudomonas syringae group TaxID=136849 RepID=UPI0006E5CD1A|nr:MULTISPECIES: DUF4123 domain-containing protein [Pseudomonas syringae group]KPY28067.1 hypothetical protein ALO54_102715 [Pseudomonas syringae pv. philadelphi]RMM19443.1 hypothetical protein ALQ83_102799 [Pseudomonas syringae pv. berberidis]RMP73042.1 hypothetical protein ALQ19_102811 [Pseudomonas syringae pv. berberidis]RMQ27742.1 hypothetical protein ALQ06_102697 [Pseudomonas syringae pv. berberidis]
MITPHLWSSVQTKLGLSLYLVLDSDGQLEERDALINSISNDGFRNLFLGTPANSLADSGPFIFQLVEADLLLIKDLIKSPERNWGWLASSPIHDIEVISTHMRERLVAGERPNQAIYRFHDNRVLTRALTHLDADQYPEYLGPISRVCYWDGSQWAVTENSNPGEHPLPASPAWLTIPQSEVASAAVEFDNIRRYLMIEHTETLAKLAEQENFDSWLCTQLELARTWGWKEPEQLHFFITQSLKAPEYHLPKSWFPHNAETPKAHFERIHEESLYWQGEGSL